MAINFDELLAAGQNCISSNFEFYKRYRGMLINHTMRDAYERWWAVQRDERALDTLAWVLGIPQNIVINAARIENRYYERGGDKVLNSEKLIRGLLLNSDWLNKDAL